MVTRPSLRSWEAVVVQGTFHLVVKWIPGSNFTGNEEAVGVLLWFFQLSGVGNHSVFSLQFSPERGLWFRLLGSILSSQPYFPSVSHPDELEVAAAAVKDPQWARMREAHFCVHISLYSFNPPDNPIGAISIPAWHWRNHTRSWLGHISEIDIWLTRIPTHPVTRASSLCVCERSATRWQGGTAESSLSFI